MAKINPDMNTCRTTRPQYAPESWINEANILVGGNRKIVSGDTVIAYIPYEHKDGGTQVGNSYANARLIAAAPELLHALEGILLQYADKNASNDQLLKELGGIGYHAVLSARAAIAKAKGQ